MKTFNKLVRDKIPEIIENNGELCKTYILSEEEYLKQLNIKLEEELKEYLADGSTEELADIEEVLRAILKVKGVSYDDFETLRQNKVQKRGTFDKRIFLVSTEDQKRT